MKKLIFIILLFLSFVSGVLVGRSSSESSENLGMDSEDNSYMNQGDNNYDYYGCPNSKRVRRLNLKKVK